MYPQTKIKYKIPYFVDFVEISFSTNLWKFARIYLIFAIWFAHFLTRTFQAKCLRKKAKFSLESKNAGRGGGTKAKSLQKCEKVFHKSFGFCHFPS